MKYALIGCGRIAVNHIRAAIENKLEIAALCDIDLNKISQLIEKTGCRFDGDKYSDYKKMISDHPELELVAIATESGIHAEIALYCIDKGINVIIEKPMAMNMHDADEIVRRSRVNNVKVCVCHQNRFNKAVQLVRRSMEEGRFGKLSSACVNVLWNRDRAYYEQASWRGKRESDGGCLFNQCIHGIDLLRWMMGDEIDEVFGYMANRFHEYIECEDIGTAVVRFKNGAVGTIIGTTNVYPENLEESLYIFGEKGTVKLAGKSTNSIETWRFEDSKDYDVNDGNYIEQTENVYGNGHAALYRDMIDAVINDRPAYVDAAAGRNAVELVLAIYESAQVGLPVKLT